MDLVIILVIVAACFYLVLVSLKYFKRKAKPVKPLDQQSKTILQQHVDFYTALPAAGKEKFEQRVQKFLTSTRITGVGTTVTETDRLLIAASAIIPIFNFDHWDYINLNEVLLYPDAFDENFQLEGPGRNMLGIVGTGPYQNIMILSKQQLLHGFMDKSTDKNTAIHEFVHLIDKTDGEIDGVPEMLLGKSYIIPWLRLMHQKIAEIQLNQSEINPYGATNQAEFFAVAAEYFFQKPLLLQQNHPDLYKMLCRIFSSNNN